MAPKCPCCALAAGLYTSRRRARRRYHRTSDLKSVQYNRKSLRQHTPSGAPGHASRARLPRPGGAGRRGEANGERRAEVLRAKGERRRKPRPPLRWPIAAVAAGAQFRVASRLSNSRRPSEPPSRGSNRRSGWGIMPSTRRRPSQMPAMLRWAPLGLAAAVTSPAAST